MLSPGDSIVVGLSGGADSVALTHFLHQYGVNVTAVHVNHMLRGNESMRDEAFVQSFCREWEIPCIVRQVDVARLAVESGQSIETAGRICRYRIFAEEAKKLGAKIATAHTLSDQAETILFRLARGSGIKGLCGIPPVRFTENGIPVIRPLISTSREQVEDYCRRHALAYVTDSSNLEDAYARNLIRHQVMPVLTELNSAALEHFGNTAEVLSLEEDYLSQTACAAYEECRTQDGEGISAEAVNRLHTAVRRRVLSLLLSRHGVTPDGSMLSRIESLAGRQLREQIDKRYGEVSLPNGKVCLLRNGVLTIRRSESGEVLFPQIMTLSDFEIPYQTVYRMPSGKCWEFTFLKRSGTEVINDIHPKQNVHRNVLFFCLDYDKIRGKLICRGRLPGDCMTIAGRGVTKTVKKWMNEAGVPVWERANRFLLADEDGVVLVEGLGTAARAAADEHTVRFLTVREIPLSGVSF